jgi:hypothetical protein
MQAVEQPFWMIAIPVRIYALKVADRHRLVKKVPRCLAISPGSWGNRMALGNDRGSWSLWGRCGRLADFVGSLGPLYGVERQAKELASEKRRAIRQGKSLPMLNSFGDWLQEQKRRVLPKSPFGQAASYAFS